MPVDNQPNSALKTGAVAPANFVYVALAPVDAVYAVLVAATVVTCAFDTIFRGWDIMHFACYFGIVLFLLVTWLVVLVARCISYVVRLSDAVQMMPAAAARIVLAISKQP